MTEGAEPRVTYTVKEILDQQERSAVARHQEAMRALEAVDLKVTHVSKRVSALETERQRRSAITAGINKLWVVGAAALAILIEIPGMLYYLGGH